MKRLLSAIALTCLLAVSALAGDLPTAGLTSPGDLPTAGISSPATGTTSPGDLPTAGFAEQLSETAVSALLAALGLLTV